MPADVNKLLENAPQIEFTNDKGHVMVSARKKWKDKVIGLMGRCFDPYDHLRVQNANGGFSIAIGQDKRTGKLVWAHIEMKINDKDPDINNWSGKKMVSTDVVVPQLFGEGMEAADNTGGDEDSCNACTLTDNKENQ